jgi:hypothetical protein
MGASLVLRIWFSWYMLIFVPIDEVITWDLENFVTISLPAWAISGADQSFSTAGNQYEPVAQIHRTSSPRAG